MKTTTEKIATETSASRVGAEAGTEIRAERIAPEGRTIARGATGTLVYPPIPAGVEPSIDYGGYPNAAHRYPREPLVILPHTLSERTGPVYPYGRIGPLDNDLTQQRPAAPVGERILVHGRVVDEDDRPVPETLVEIWQANAAGRYTHKKDQHHAPLDPNFTGAGRTVTDADGHYQFTTVMPGRYPWHGHYNAWRPAHIHFSIFGPCFLTRLVTQMYFPGDPLQRLDPIFNAIPNVRARERLVAAFDLDGTLPDWALAFRFDIVLRGRLSTPMEG